MPATGRILAAALFVACGAAQAAAQAPDTLTAPSSPLYQPSPEVRAQVRDVMGHAHRQPRPQPAPAANQPAGDQAAAATVPSSLVAAAQRELAAQGYDVGAADGAFGPRTRAGLQAFQRDHGLPADGRLNFALLNRLMVRPADDKAALPAVAAPPPAEPAVVQFSTRRALGKTVHDLPGDLLGTVADFVITADDVIAAVVVATVNGYGTHEGTVMVPFAQVRHAITRAAVVLPLTAEQALPLRDKPHPFALADGQRLLGKTDATADTDGKLIAAAR